MINLKQLKINHKERKIDHSTTNRHDSKQTILKRYFKADNKSTHFWHASNRENEKTILQDTPF